MESVRDPYRKWEPNTIKGKRVWSRYKEGSDRALPALVLFTGLGINGTRLNPVIDELSRTYRGSIIGVELPGQGISQRLGFRLRALHYAVEMEHILNQLVPGFDQKRAVFIGHCHSPFFLNAYAQRREVAGTVLLNPFPMDSYTMMARSCLKLGSVFLNQFWGKLSQDSERFMDGHAARTLLTDRMKKAVNFIEAGFMWRTASYGTQLNESPVLIAIGENDDVVSHAYAEMISRRIANSELKVIPGCTHFSTFKEPVETARLILDFIDRIRP
jgi:pimeloyl-ACP methyl ester carboxylesterase